ncbi:hypothetical protein F5X68DRAFT_253822, partial [Plectosphaerella plurivora]
RRWELQDPVEVLLLDHFVHELSGFFDFCDQERHFAIQVPQRARACRPLLDAILALSARHLGRVRGDIDPLLADRYYQRCLESLIPELGRVAPACVDDLLTATVVLRLLEELDVPLRGGTDAYRHSAGTRALLCSQLTSQEHMPCATGLRRAASWTGLRQEIWVCLSMEQAPAMRASAELLGYLDPQRDDCAWANLAVSHCLDVLDFCFGANPGTVAAYDALLASNRWWEADRPPSYDPFCCRAKVGEAVGPLWEIALQLPWHVMGWQYRNLARVLLITHDPRMPRLGLGRQTAQRKMEATESNPSVPAAMVIAYMAVRICGDLIEDLEERRIVLKLLARLEDTQGWPTLELKTSLEEVWG